ncbi:hypothetical protein [Pannonibacter phragmitetus]|uniref:Glycine-zipper-containing OmpA-like membrane domain-containing protein n=1 Tax=Pannonibacter phragmitetus TaxID=121719 RepID=A0A0U3PYS9_9HYPH|nr:hypothetical protein [Pannonibacter phragmitetus]ALV29444.1 hypothetical protein APZ00_22370 [Pannonibacter phragmitetus]
MPTVRALFPVLFLAAALAAAGAVLPAAAQGLDMTCDASARDFANAHAGSGRDMGTSILEGAMSGTVAGGAWAGTSGAERGAHAGAALGVLGTMAQDPRVWQALYDSAYRTCLTQRYSAPAQGAQMPPPPQQVLPQQPAPSVPLEEFQSSGGPCGSSASYRKFAPGTQPSTFTARSGGNCQ